MKKFLVLSLLAFNFLSLQSHAEKIDLKCEEGVGNLANPVQYLQLKGDLNVKNYGDLTLADKNKLELKIQQNGQMISVPSSSYTANLDGDFETAILKINIQDKKITISTVAGASEAMIKIIQGKTLILNKDKVIGSGVCWGGGAL